MIRACAVDQGINPSPFVLHVLHKRRCRLWVRDIALNSHAPAPLMLDRLDRLGPLFLTGAIADGDGPALVGQG